MKAKGYVELSVLMVIICFRVFPEDFENRMFPDKIQEKNIYEYLAGKTVLTRVDACKEYVYILDFLKKCNEVFKENIKNYYCLKNAKKFNPVLNPILNNGQLCFEEEKNIIYYFDKESGQYMPGPDTSSVEQIVNLIVAWNTFNQFIDHWFFATGDVLYDKFNINEELKRIKDTISNYESPPNHENRQPRVPY
jgi:hypothetical protein